MSGRRPRRRAELALADTSVFIAIERERPPLGPPPEAVAISMITVGELRLGVLAAGDGPTRARRLETLSRAERFEPLPVNRAVAHAWAILRLALRAEGKRMPLNDSWIAATAIANRIPVVSQDDDYDGGPGTGSDPRLSTVSSPTKRSRLLRLIETDQTSETRNAQLIHPSRTPKIFPVLTTRLVGD